jgi:hypothetical protein
LKPSGANSSSRPYLEKTLQKKKKKAGGVDQDVGPEFKPQNHKKTYLPGLALNHDPPDFSLLSSQE